MHACQIANQNMHPDIEFQLMFPKPNMEHMMKPTATNAKDSERVFITAITLRRFHINISYCINDLIIMYKPLQLLA